VYFLASSVKIGFEAYCESHDDAILDFN
jgi:hypothetical protein